MKKPRSSTASRLFTARAPLAALGLKLRSLKLFETISEHVHIKQKTIKHTPIEKLTDAFIAILAGAHGLSEINTRVRSDCAVQRAFGRKDCAEQSVVQETLDHCTSENAQQMQAAVDELFRTHSQAFSHDYKTGLQLLDIDMSGLPCGPQSEHATYGYFGRHNIRYGRQMGRVLAARYEEVVADRVYPGNLQLRDCLPHLVEALEKTLELDEAKRARTVLRMDAGGGSFNSVNYLLKRGYHLHGKDYSAKRAANLSKYVRQWVADPRHPDRQLGWVEAGSPGYVREVRRLVMRWRKRNGQVCHHLLLSTLEPADIMQLMGQSSELTSNPQTVAVAYARLYDQRGGTIEIELKESKQGIGMTKRNKKRYAAQQMVMLLGTLAHNVVVWAKRWLMADAPKLKRYGVPRLIRDVLQVSGFLELEATGLIKRIVLNGASALARHCAKSLRVLLKREHVAVILGET
jgi:hypothetical protein